MPTAPDERLQALIDHCAFETAQACFRKLCPGSFQRMDQPLENPDSERFTEFRQFGELPLDGDTLLFAYAEAETDLTERSARKAQFDAARSILRNKSAIDAGIFIFRGANGAFRLSYITKIYKATKAEFSHFRRYTYFVDPAAEGHHTFIKQVSGCAFDSLASIQEAFSVEAINKDFYKELSNWYFWAMKHVHFPTDDIALNKKDLLSDKAKIREHDAKNLIRLLTRMLFVWFIKQRGLVPREIFDPETIARDYLEGFDPQSRDTRYYKAILQNFFFAVLNQERKDREFRKMGSGHRDNMCLMRYKSAFKDPRKFIETIKAFTPFLNGGLFECLDFLHPTEKGPQGGRKKIYEDGFSDHKENPLEVPDFLFFAPEHAEDLSDTWGIASKNNEPVLGLIHILNRYNFTIVENSPIEQEVALDPELLGKVFENLLASYNPETQTTARKQTGSFYTPRPIVDYMVDESLKAYLKQRVEQTFLSASSYLKQRVEQTFLSASSTTDTQTEMSEPPISKSRRNLPHWKKRGATYWITFRMADSLPQAKLEAWKAERDAWKKTHPEPWDDNTWREYNKRFGERLEQWLDAGMGSCALARSDVREAVKACLLKFDGERLIVYSAVIMPNHVHALITPLGGEDISKLLQGIKGASAREANKILGTSGTFWLDESFDHIVRSAAQYRHYLSYIQENPIKANLPKNKFWLHKSDTDIPVCNPKSGTDIPVCNPKSGTDIPVCN
ncbi:MAG: transposase, partial [Opitutales bacterium]